MRHAKSAWDTGAESDAARPLNKRGRRDAPRMGKWLKQQGHVPDCLLSSPSLRTRQTVEYLRHELGLSEKLISWVDELYHPGLRDMLELIGSAQEDCQSLMLVSHNPGLEALLLHLCEDSQAPGDRGKLLPTAAVAVLSCQSSIWSADRAGYSLVELLRPRELQD